MDMISAQRSTELRIGEIRETIPCSPRPGEILSPATVGSFLDRLPPRPMQFIRFCLVGVSGTVVDMTILCLLADPRCLGLNVTLSKIVAAEVALITNFIGNELWTFKAVAEPSRDKTAILRRFALLNIICGAGIVLAVLLLYVFHSWLGFNLYLSNLLAIGIVTTWNFAMNARFNWHLERTRGSAALSFKSEAKSPAGQRCGYEHCRTPD